MGGPSSSSNTKKATRDGYGDALVELGKEKSDVVVLDADLSGSTKTKDFRKQFPDRFFNVGVAEQNLVGHAAGLALAGFVPFASSFAMFLSGRAWEVVRNSVVYPKLNVKLVASHGGITVGEDGASHQCIEDFAIMRVIPEMTVICPSDYEETKQVIHKIYEYKGPVYVR
ncbi:MAG: transketolase family protein, partial [Leptospiraceae bacterium]|nr:transketolase family protein [Leptospiraceae bacterium]